MILRTRLCCSSLLKLNPRRLVLHIIVSGSVTAAFLFFMLLTVNNYSWIPKRLVSADILSAGNLFNLRYLRGRINNVEQEPTKPEEEEPVDTLPDIYKFKYIINEPNKCRENRPFLILLIAVQARQSEARQAIRRTWGGEDFVPGIHILRLFLLGKDATAAAPEAQRALLNESVTYHDIIQQDYLDTYHNLTLKTLTGMRWVATYCPQIPYVMKTDSDMFVNTEYLVNKLLIPDQPPRENYITGYVMKGSSPHRNTESKWYVAPKLYPGEHYPSFCSGTGYVFSGDLAEKIFRVSENVTFLHLEDVFVGLCLDRLGISPVPPPKETDFSYWKVTYSDCVYNQIVTSHQFKPNELIDLWERLQRNKHNCVR